MDDYTSAQVEVARDHLRELGMTLSLRDGEWRVNYRWGREASAYYTTDLEDAYSTGCHMASCSAHEHHSRRRH